MNDLWNIIPTNPAVETVGLTGNEIRVMLEENLERTSSSNPYQQMGGYVKRCRGIRLHAEIENPARRRKDRLFALGAPGYPDRRYKVAFVTEQGVPTRFGCNRTLLNTRAINALQHCLALSAGGSRDNGSVTAV